MAFITLSKVISIANTIKAKITEATMTTIVEFCNCENVGQVTLLTSSLYEFFTYLNIILSSELAGAERFELPSTVLETAALPLYYSPKHQLLLTKSIITQTTHNNQVYFLKNFHLWIATHRRKILICKTTGIMLQ